MPPTSKVDAVPLRRLPPGAVELWSIQLGEVEAQAHVAGIQEDLVQDDQQAASLIRDPVSRALFLAGRQAQRRILSTYVAQSPQALHIARPRQGKPVLHAHPDLHFSFSRRGAHALLAVAAAPVGVDLEMHRGGWRPQELMAVIGSAAERQRVSALPAGAQADAVMRCWTAKEACVKASGWGLALPPHSFDVGPLVADPRTPAWSLSLPSLTQPAWQCWSVQSLEVATGWSAALAVSAASKTPVRIARLEWVA